MAGKPATRTALEAGLRARRNPAKSPCRVREIGGLVARICRFGVRSRCVEEFEKRIFRKTPGLRRCLVAAIGAGGFPGGDFGVDRVQHDA